jgi:CheY-like chemotaxis protein
MTAADAKLFQRILVIDDHRAIHEDFRKILAPSPDNRAALEAAEFNLFGLARSAVRTRSYVVESAYQGQEGAARVEQALAAGEPYAMAFVDMRMPPGWNGLETIARLWEFQPDLQVVLCTAHSDYSLDESRSSPRATGCSFSRSRSMDWKCCNWPTPSPRNAGWKPCSAGTKRSSKRWSPTAPRTSTPRSRSCASRRA